MWKCACEFIILPFFQRGDLLFFNYSIPFPSTLSSLTVVMLIIRF